MAARTLSSRRKVIPVSRFLLAAFEFEAELDEEKLLKNQADVRRSAKSLKILQALSRFRPVNFPQSLARRNQAEMLPYRVRNRVRQLLRQIA